MIRVRNEKLEKLCRALQVERNQLQDQIREVKEMCGSVKTAVSHSLYIPQLEREGESVAVGQRLKSAPTEPESDSSPPHITPSHPPQSEREGEVSTSEETETLANNGV